MGNPKDERYTQAETLADCLKLAGLEKYDLDVAACDAAHCAETYYTEATNGLLQPWFGNVWLQPPYSNIWPWIEKAWQEHEHCDSISCLIPGNRQEQPGWQEHVEPFRDRHVGIIAPVLTTHYLPRRRRFGAPGDLLGENAGSPEWNSVLLIWRDPTAPRAAARPRPPSRRTQDPVPPSPSPASGAPAA